MSSSNLSPLAVVKYSQAFLIGLVRVKTGWDQRSEVSVKAQLNYLCRYLEEKHIDAQTIVLEDEYIDRHYLEDYAAYYARCFPSHSRKCSRVHFFSTQFDESNFVSALEGNNKTFLKKLADNYIGFAVIRPIPHTFLAKLCLKRYSALTGSSDYKLIANSIKVSLFGIPLEVKSAAFLEQDKVVSACATSALWMLFNASEQTINGGLPSPSAITTSATGSPFDGARTFPTAGLSPIQVSRSLKFFGFEPLIFDEPAIFSHSSNYTDFKEIIFGYVNNDIPVLVGGDVYQKSANGEVKLLGRHFVCVLGYKLGTQKSSSGSLKLMSHRVDKIYVHDDRYGPYLRASMRPVLFKYEESLKEEKTEEPKNKILHGLKFSIKGTRVADYFVPDIAIVGLYHKIRLSYIDIWNICNSLFVYLRETKLVFDNLLTDNSDLISQNAKRYPIESESIQHFLSGICDISLTTNTKIKEQLRSNKSFKTFNGAATKSACLLQSMPKYIWRCRVFKVTEESTNQMYTDILFDATEVPQGQVLVGYITYDILAERVWKQVECFISQNLWEKFNLDLNSKRHISGFLKFFSKQINKTNLNTLYGPLGLPRRNQKPGETDDHNNIRSRIDTQLIRAGSTDFWRNLSQRKRYIWVINDSGDLVLGEDVNKRRKFQGHLTLVDGKPARLGGELYYSTKSHSWLVNLNSGTYSTHIKFGSPLWSRYLKNVIEMNLKGNVVKIQKGQEREP